MADNIDLDTDGVELFATASMKPVGDEEANALYWRKMAGNSARGVGVWGTLILGTSTNLDFGTGFIDFSALSFNQMPSLDVYQLRGGTEVKSVNAFWESAAPKFFGFQMFVNGGTHMKLVYYPDSFTGVKRDFTTGTGQQHWGTFIYRLRGW